MAASPDVVIIGGALMGSATAYFLAADADFDGRVTVVERDPTYGDTATARSWGGFRRQFSLAKNIEMAAFGREFYGNVTALLAVDGDGPDLAMRRQGYLYLASAGGVASLRENTAVQWAAGARTELLTPAGLVARFPWLNVDGLAAGAFGGTDEGWIDPYALMQGFRRKARALGVEYRHDEVVGIERKGRRVTGVALAAGDRLACAVMVNAAGPNAGRVAEMAGIALPVRPRKRITYVFDCRAPLAHLPLTIDPSGLAFRPEGRQYLAIQSPPPDRDPDSDNLDLDLSAFDTEIWPALAHRVPAFSTLRLSGGWAGHYDYNTFDQNAVIGAHPDVEGILFCNGFSGHGIQQSPAAGRAVAEWVVHGAFQSLDLSCFGIARLLDNCPMLERNII